MRLSLRLAVVFGVGALIAVASVATASWALARSEVTSRTDEQIQLRAERIAALSALEVDRSAVDLDPQAAEFAQILADSGEGVVALDAQGRVLSSPDVVAEDIEPDAFAELTEVEQGELVTAETGGRRLRSTALPVDRIGGVPPEVAYIVLYTDVTSQTDALNSLAYRIAILAVVAIAALGFAGWFLGRRLARPISRLSAAAEELARLDDLPARIEVNRDDEVGRLADSFNRVLSALEVGREQQQRLVADASHGLRTPLTSLRMRVEFLADADELDDDDRSLMLGAAVADLEQLSSLVEELVDLAADVRSEAEEPVAVALAPILSEVADRSIASSRRDISVVADDSRAVVRPGMIRRAVQNLVDNAVKYSPVDQPITIRLHDGRIEVHDCGPGIDPDDAPHVFDRFYRSPRARSRPGHGIGLAIVKQVADAHGGRVWAATNPEGGARVGFSVWN